MKKVHKQFLELTNLTQTIVKLEGAVEFKALPSGLHNVNDDLV